MVKQITYVDEVRHANRIAACSTGDEAARCVADAVLASRQHGVHMVFTDLVIRYSNGFGPTCAVDDMLESMLISDWRTGCQTVVDVILARAGLPSKALHPDRFPVVTLVPEEDTPIIGTVIVRLPLPIGTADAVKAALSYEKEME